jgi:pimeloyl-ACP methyl ester carboxylesterase
MPFADVGQARLYYEEHGSGFPVLLIAPGGMRSAMSFWENAPWNPIEHLSTDYRVIAMDQRNAGQSTAPVRSSDGWPVYTADQLGLMDALGIDKFHVFGMCIGGSYAMGLIEAAPERVASAVMLQPIGLHENRQVFYGLFDEWVAGLKPEHPDVAPETWQSFKTAMYGGDFLFNVSRDFVAACETPLLVLMGNDVYHPEDTSRAIAALAPNATLVEAWKTPEHVKAAKAVVATFLAENSRR